MSEMRVIPTVITHELGGLLASGADDTSVAAAFLTDSTASWTVNAFVGATVFNDTDGSSGTVTANTATTITATLSGGSVNVWNSGDAYRVVSLGALTGVAPDGTDSEEGEHRGRYRIWTGCSDGGLVEFPTSIRGGFRVERVSWNLPGLSGVDLYVVDPDGVLFLVGQYTGSEGYFEWRNGGTLVAPRFKFAAVSQGGSLSDIGRVMFVLGQGWGQTTLEQAKELGREGRVPDMQRP